MLYLIYLLQMFYLWRELFALRQIKTKDFLFELGLRNAVLRKKQPPVGRPSPTSAAEGAAAPKGKWPGITFIRATINTGDFSCRFSGRM